MSIPVWAWILIAGVVLAIVIIAAGLYAIYHFVSKKRESSDDETDQSSADEPVMVKVATLKRPSLSQSLSTEKISKEPSKSVEKVEERTGGKKSMSRETAPKSKEKLEKSKEKLEKSMEKSKPASKEPVREMSTKGSQMKPLSKTDAPAEKNDNIRSKRSLDKMNEIWDMDFDTLTTNSNTKRPTLHEAEPPATAFAKKIGRERRRQPVQRINENRWTIEY